jgi:hypothetical protein
MVSGVIEILYPTAPTLNPEADTNANGLPDSWEIENFGALGVVSSADEDGDGTTNLMEFLAGTNPRSAASVFRPTSRIESGKLILSVPTVSGRNYRVWGTANLQTGWGSEPLDTIHGDGSIVKWEYLMSQSSSGRFFLRVEIMIP